MHGRCFDSERVEYEAIVKPHGVTEHWLRVRIAAERDRDAAEEVEVICRVELPDRR